MNWFVVGMPMSICVTASAMNSASVILGGRPRPAAGQEILHAHVEGREKGVDVGVSDALLGRRCIWPVLLAKARNMRMIHH